MALPDGLLDAVKNYLDITWSLDNAGEQKLSGIIARGMSRLNKAAGAVLDFSKEEKPRELLMDYCRYVRSNALDEFEKNYEHELIDLQNDTEIKYWAALTSLTIGSMTLSPAFDVAVKEYTAATSNASDVISAVSAQSLALVQIFVGETLIVNGAAATWSEGENVVTINVTSGSTTNVYTVTVTKA
jgi:hypothetical protein